MRRKQFLIVGRSGMGKSSLINATFGRYIAETAQFEACTRLVGYHAYGTPWGDLELIDTPGFAEGGQREDERAVALIAAGVDISKIDAVLFVTRLDETRMRPDEARMIDLLTSAFGKPFWHKAWLMMTFAASVPSDARGRRSQARQSDLIGAVQASLVRHFGLSSFKRFRSAWLIDNIVRGWSSDLIPIGQVLSRVA
jgi:hypothetical protein